MLLHVEINPAIMQLTFDHTLLQELKE